ncbi:MAG: GTPase ObgE [Planctomycetes bacterium]|nr:GTPase ObgE [Planctomycetota bacterium]
MSERLEQLFWDEASIEVAAGHGGAGAISFRREAFVTRGGPDGGDGGRGGDVVLVADRGLASFLGFRGRPLWEAEDGKAGTSRNCTGRSAEDLVIRVPVGTVVRDALQGNVLKDLNEDGLTLIVAKGGLGGHGNAYFATATRRTPRFAQPGLPGERRKLRLDLKLIADVGLVGLPNAGKSTLISRLSALRPKIADYPFTTLQPALGVVAIDAGKSLTLADLPGLIEGAHEGHGLGDRFLRHIERTRVIAHLVDVGASAEMEPLQAVRVIERELAAFSSTLASKPRLLVATKVESEEAEELARALATELKREILLISSATGRGLGELKGALWKAVGEVAESGTASV